MISRLNIIKKKSGMSPGSLIFTGEQKVENIKIDIFQYNQSMVTEKKLDNVDELKDLANNQSVLWINICGLHEIDKLEKISEIFNINSLAMEDILNVGHSPKLEDHEQYIFMISKMLEYNSETRRIVSEQISFILGKNYLITFQEKEGDVVHVPARVWHQVLLEPGSAMTYMLINVNEPD
jgi:magnesium transporter